MTETRMSFARVIVANVNDDDFIHVVRHYNGSGSYTNLTEVYVIRSQKFLGRFVDEKFEVSVEHPKKPSESDLKEYQKALFVLKATSEKLWK